MCSWAAQAVKTTLMVLLHLECFTPSSFYLYHRKERERKKSKWGQCWRSLLPFVSVYSISVQTTALFPSIWHYSDTSSALEYTTSPVSKWAYLFRLVWFYSRTFYLKLSLLWTQSSRRHTWKQTSHYNTERLTRFVIYIQNKYRFNSSLNL